MHRFSRRALSTTRRVLDAAVLDAEPVVLNRYSRHVTEPKQQGASQAMLYATDGVDSEEDLKKPMIGIGSVWYEGNPCNKHLLDIGKEVKKSMPGSGLIGYQFGTVGVSDGISMGTQGMRYSLPSRDLIADQIETAAGGHWLDGMVVIPGCDKNMPGVLMGVARINRPSIMVYGGTIRAGHCPGPLPPSDQPLDIVSAFQAYGKYVADGMTEEAEKERANTIRYACPGAGACGGMYTANTMASNAEILGMTLPGSSSFPADSPEKMEECASIGPALRNLLEKNILPSDILTKTAFENAIALTMVMGGSTNAVLHLTAIAANAGVRLKLEDYERIAEKTPVLADLRPSGKYVFEDIYKLGGMPKIMFYLLENGFIDGDTMTVTGKSLSQNLQEWVAKHGKLPTNQRVIRPLGNPIKTTGHIRVLRGNLAPGGAISKITGKEGLYFEGRARVFNSEDAFIKAFDQGAFVKGEKVVVVLRYLGPRGGPGMPEMLKPTSMIMGAGLGEDVAFVTDGRFSGGSHGFVVGHVVPEAIAGGRIGLVADGDIIKIDAVKNTIDHVVARAKLRERVRRAPPREGLKRGWLKLYSLNVTDASSGCVLGIRKDLRSRLVDFKVPEFRTRQNLVESRNAFRERQIVESGIRSAQRKAINDLRMRAELEKKAGGYIAEAEIAAAGREAAERETEAAIQAAEEAKRAWRAARSTARAARAAAGAAKAKVVEAVAIAASAKGAKAKSSKPSKLTKSTKSSTK